MAELRLDDRWAGSILSNNETAALRAGHFTLDCLNMKVVRRGEGPGTAEYSGSGQIRQADDGGLRFTIYDQAAQATLEDVLPVGRQPGEWLAEYDFFDLTATDWRARTWSAEWIRPDVSGRHGEPGAIVRGGIRELTSRLVEQPVKCSFIRMAMLGEVEILTSGGTEVVTRRAGREGKSFSRDIWIIEDDEERIEIVKSDLGLDVSWAAEPPRPLPPGGDTRLEEAIWLMTFQPLQWFLLEEGSVTGDVRAAIRPRRDHSVRHRLSPPVESRHIEAITDASDLFLRYLRRIRTYGEPLYHPVSSQLRRVLHASARSIEDEALSLGVAVERMLRDECSDLAAPSATIMKAVDDLLAHIGSWNGSPAVLDRARGCIGQIKGPSPRQALKKLVRLGRVADRHREAWNRVRHAAAHGAQRSTDFKTQVADCDLVRELYLILIARWLEYRGRMTQITVVGHPLRTADEIVSSV